jgi:hypothetical protein
MNRPAHRHYFFRKAQAVKHLHGIGGHPDASSYLGKAARTLDDAHRIAFPKQRDCQG